MADLPTLLEFEQGIVEAERPMAANLKPGRISYYDIGELIESDEAEVVVAVFGEELIGSGYVKILPSKDYLTHDRHGYIGFMFVRPEFRGRGVSQAVTDELISWARNRGLKEVKLEVYDGNDSAIRAYEKAGFTNNLIEMRRSI